MPQLFLCARGIAKMAIDGIDFKGTGVPRIYQVTEGRLASSKNNILEVWAQHTSAPAKF